MTVEEELREKRVVVVGVQIDSHGRELLNWAILKVAEPGDHIVGVHVCKNSVVAKTDKPLLDGIVETYDELCKIKQVSLTGRISLGKSIKKGLVSEAKVIHASVVIVGITLTAALGQGTSAARYCAKHLPLPTEVMAINNGKVVYKSISSKNVSDLNGEHQKSFRSSRNITVSETRSECRYTNSLSSLCKGDLSETRSFSRRLKRVSLRSSAHCTTDVLEQIPGWPLLRTNSVTSLPKASSERKKISVVQWVMSLPDRSPPLTPQSSKDSGSPQGLDESVDSLGIYGDRRDRCKFSSPRSELHKEFECLLDSVSSHIKLFSYDSMSNATSQFSSANLIGKGGCNHVYNGVLPDGKLVAVKVTMSSKEAQKNFLQEIEIVSALRHKNIVPLLGVCIEDSNLISVYDLLPKGSLEENLLDAKARCLLTWEVRFKIAVGVAEALSYIHSQCSKPVVHRDVKSSNILLSDTLEPQLSDFGLAIWGPEKSAFFTRADVVGTFGYLAPEYFMYGKVSEKIDVYSFGVVLLELLSGRRPISSDSPKSQESLVIWARPLLNKGDANGLLDPNLRGSADETQVKQIVSAARLCLTRSARLRPNMTEVLRLIKGEQVPEQPEWLNVEQQAKDDLTNSDDTWDDEVYPESCAESHLSMAFQDVTEDSNSFSSTDRSNNRLSVDEYLKGRWSRSSSLENQIA